MAKRKKQKLYKRANEYRMKTLEDRAQQAMAEAEAHKARVEAANLWITVLLRKLECDSVVVTKEELAAAFETEVRILPDGDSFVVKIQ